MARRGNSAERGYGYEHRRIRAALLPYAYGTPCPKCGELMERGQDLDLGHTDDRSAYTGIEHAFCNRKAGSLKGHRLKRQKRQSLSRDW